MSDERVLVVPRGDLFLSGEETPQGFIPGDGRPYLERMAHRGRFAARRSAEEDPGLKQIIPYGLVTSGDRVFLLRRTRGGAEARLHDLLSLGVGGHVNPQDGAPGRGGEILERAFLRELEEELVVDSSYRLRVAGVLNDESNAVGQVHFGVVYRVDLEAPRIRVREVGQLEGRWVRRADLAGETAGMETWSRFLALELSRPDDVEDRCCDLL
ncbi:MAG: NUDIX domain-containing protein [Planctomycetes bacterium]|nr:NUDIX domain-containing protein [Planctomycetota bacterium]